MREGATAAARGLLLAAGAGALAGGFTGGVEAAHLAAVARRFFLTGRELREALGATVGIHAALGVAAALGAVLVAGALAAIGLRRSAEPARGAAPLVAVLVALGATAASWALTSGPRARIMPLRSAAVVLLGAACGIAVRWLLPRVAAVLAAAPRRRRVALALAGLGLAGGLVLADARVLPRLYPLFHALVGALALLAAIGAMLLLLSGTRLSRRWWSFAPGALAVIAVASSAMSIGRLLDTQNARGVLADHAPGVARALALVGALGWRPRSAAERLVELTPELEREIAPGRVDDGELPPLDVDDRDLLLVTIDALRADHLGCYGYGRPTSPRIDAIARRGVVFERAYTATPQTSYAIASLLTGKYVRALFRLDEPPSTETLAHMLRARGMHTAAFFTDAVFFIDRQQFRAFEEDRFGFEYNKMHPVDARPRLEQVREYLAARAPDDRVFVWVHFFEPHEPYVPHGEHRFGDRDVDLYDGEIAEADRAIGELVEMFRRRGGEPIVIVAADHGEEFGDHGGRYHGSTLYEEQARVPLVVSVPGVEPRRVSAPVQTVDVVPTVLGLYGLPWSARVRGTDLRPLMFGRGLETRAFAEGPSHRMVVAGADKLICDTGGEICRLFDLERDPAERRNLADRDPGRVTKLRRALSAWAASHARFERAETRTSAGEGWPEPIRRAQLGDEGARADTVELLRTSRDARIRAKAAEVLGPLGGPGVAEPLVAALADPEAAVSTTAALSLLEIGDARGREGAVRVAADEGAPPVLRNRALLALADRGDAIAAPGLRALVVSEEATAESRIAAIGRLGQLRDRAAVQLLVSQLDDVRQKLAIVEALGAIGDRRAIAPLERVVVDDPYDSVRTAAARALAGLGRRSSCGALRRSLEGREPVVGALDALVALGCVPELAVAAPEGWRCSPGGSGCRLPLAGAQVPGPPRGPWRLVVSWSAAGDGGRLRVGSETIEVVAGRHQSAAEVSAPGRVLSIAADPADLDVTLHALLAVRRR